MCVCLCVCVERVGQFLSSIRKRSCGGGGGGGAIRSLSSVRSHSPFHSPFSIIRSPPIIRRPRPAKAVSRAMTKRCPNLESRIGTGVAQRVAQRRHVTRSGLLSFTKIKSKKCENEREQVHQIKCQMCQVELSATTTAITTTITVTKRGNQTKHWTSYALHATVQHVQPIPYCRRSGTPCLHPHSHPLRGDKEVR